MTPYVVLLDMPIDIWTFLVVQELDLSDSTDVLLLQKNKTVIHYYCKPSTGTSIAQLSE